MAELRRDKFGRPVLLIRWFKVQVLGGLPENSRRYGDSAKNTMRLFLFLVPFFEVESGYSFCLYLTNVLHTSFISLTGINPLSSSRCSVYRSACGLSAPLSFPA